MLWFDVESKYEATISPTNFEAVMLWFDVESKYEATARILLAKVEGCGLM